MKTHYFYPDIVVLFLRKRGEGEGTHSPAGVPRNKKNQLGGVLLRICLGAIPSLPPPSPPLPPMVALLAVWLGASGQLWMAWNWWDQQLLLLLLLLSPRGS